jgi:hypothetical protein
VKQKRLEFQLNSIKFLNFLFLLSQSCIFSHFKHNCARKIINEFPKKQIRIRDPVLFNPGSQIIFPRTLKILQLFDADPGPFRPWIWDPGMKKSDPGSRAGINIPDPQQC